MQRVQTEDEKREKKECYEEPGNGRGFFRFEVLASRRGGAGVRPTFSGGKLYEGAELRVPGTIGRGRAKPELVVPMLFTESLENSPRPELGVCGSRGLWTLLVAFDFRFTSAGISGTGGAPSKSGRGVVPMYEEATAVPPGAPTVVAWYSEGTLMILCTGLRWGALGGEYGGIVFACELGAEFELEGRGRLSGVAEEVEGRLGSFLRVIGVLRAVTDADGVFLLVPVTLLVVPGLETNGRAANCFSSLSTLRMRRIIKRMIRPTRSKAPRPPPIAPPSLAVSLDLW